MQVNKLEDNQIIENEIYFSSQLKMNDLDFTNKTQVINALKERLREYYLEPIKKLNKGKHCFAAGVLLITTIEAICFYTINKASKTRMISFFMQAKGMERYNDNLKMKKSIAIRLVSDFREGLIIEGRIKKGGLFSYDYDCLLTVIDNYMIINPNYLYEEIETFLNLFFSELTKNKVSYDFFIKEFKRQFSDIFDFV